MCGRYYIAEDDAAEELRQIIEAVNRRSPDAKTGGEIRPGDTVAVLANSPSLQPSAYAMHWGYTLPDGKLLFNARSETAVEKAIFKDGMAQRRCLIPATCYFEWEHRGKDKIKYAIAPENNDMIYLAGIYRKEGHRASCTILTREPAESSAFIHNRRPVILPSETIGDWLNVRYEATDVLKAAQTEMGYHLA